MCRWLQKKNLRNFKLFHYFWAIKRFCCSDGPSDYRSSEIPAFPHSAPLHLTNTHINKFWNVLACNRAVKFTGVEWWWCFWGKGMWHFFLHWFDYVVCVSIRSHHQWMSENETKNAGKRNSAHTLAVNESNPVAYPHMIQSIDWNGVELKHNACKTERNVWLSNNTLEHTHNSKSETMQLVGRLNIKRIHNKK